MRFEEELSDTGTEMLRPSRFNIHEDNTLERNKIDKLEENERLSKKKCATEIERFHFCLVNEKVVNDITLEALYKPHTLTVLALLCAYLLYKAFSG